MVRLTKIYTKTGDSGQTGLGDGSWVSKASARIAEWIERLERQHSYLVFAADN